MNLGVKLVYMPADAGDGLRILVDRLWPRGVSKVSLADVPWLKEIAARTELRKWFDHRPAKWSELKHRYLAELDANPAAVAELRRCMGKHRTTLLYAAHDVQHGNAVALREYLLADSHASHLT